MKVKKAERISGQNIYLHSGHIARRISPNERIEAMAKEMKALSISHISPSHSSPRHDRIFKEVFGASYIPALVGKKSTDRAVLKLCRCQREFGNFEQMQLPHNMRMQTDQQTVTRFAGR